MSGVPPKAVLMYVVHSAIPPVACSAVTDAIRKIHACLLRLMTPPRPEAALACFEEAVWYLSYLWLVTMPIKDLGPMLLVVILSKG